MLKKIIILFTIICFSSVHAQYEWTPAKVILKNGTSFRGLVKFPKHFGGLISIGSTEFKYKKKRKSGTVAYGHDTVEEVIFGDEDFTTVHYKYVPIKKKKFVLMELITSGKVSLYSRTVLRSQTSFLGDPDFESTTFYDDTDYYLIRNTEEKAKYISGVPNNKMFIYVAKRYFSDCSKIVNYLENELYRLNDIIELVDHYNLLCE